MVADTLLYPKTNLDLRRTGWGQNDRRWWFRAASSQERAIAETCQELFGRLGRESNVYALAGTVFARDAETARIFDQEVNGER
ncbi:hypothetical protein SAMN05216548_11464 [Faunimonas pinastri]|uniref:Uncharacterized protein n=1 Tax=Faunimonas pinastri TaxID=1855383 RepID=A0A1H9MV49_9HYPH|nr:hypothetical protein [Faunimonas pinastri]SER27574.1 hypothetical protein SAMN05216548_11464 [Faunimonas pinastri]